MNGLPGGERRTLMIDNPHPLQRAVFVWKMVLPIRPTGIFNHNSLYKINMGSVRDIEVIKGPAFVAFTEAILSAAQFGFITKIRLPVMPKRKRSKVIITIIAA